jgi:hypothetical protein
VQRLCIIHFGPIRRFLKSHFLVREPLCAQSIGVSDIHGTVGIPDNQASVLDDQRIPSLDDLSNPIMRLHVDRMWMRDAPSKSEIEILRFGQVFAIRQKGSKGISGKVYRVSSFELPTEVSSLQLSERMR